MNSLVRPLEDEGKQTLSLVTQTSKNDNIRLGPKTDAAAAITMLVISKRKL